MNSRKLTRREVGGDNQLRLPLLIAAGLALSLPVLVAAQDIDPTSDPNTQPYASTPVSGYQLAWSDEFNGSAVDTKKWNFRTGVRYWSVQQPQNNAVSNGLYYLLLKKETVGTNQYTAGGLISKKAVRYGYYEARMRVPPGRGWHTSFWMMSGGMPVPNTAIELDALENDSVNHFKYGVNTHRHQPTPHVTYGSKTVSTPSLNADFHVIGCEFTPTTIMYFFEGALVQTVDATQFAHTDLNIWLTSVAAPLGGTTNVDDSLLPNVAEFDYARFFVLGPTSTVSIVTPNAAGVTLADTNTALHVAASVTSSDSNYLPSIAWSKVSGPGSVTFAIATNADTTAKFSAPGSYVLQCQAVVLNSTNIDQVAVAVAAPLTASLRQGVGGYAHVATFIRGDSPGWNSGGRDQFIVGRWGGQPLRPALSFDLSPLDPSAVVQSIALDVWTDSTPGTGAVGDVELRKLTSTPVEGTGDGSSASNGAGTGATWLSRTGGTNVSDLWTNGGGDFETNILSSAPGYDAAVAGVQRTFGSTAGFVAAAQGALNAAQPLNVLLLSPTTEAGTNNFISRISSDDIATKEQRPLLSLTFLGNVGPTIWPGNALTALVAVPTQLIGSVSNADGSLWSLLSGPGTVSFSNPAVPGTTASFSRSGDYFLRLTASNRLCRVSRDLSVTVVASRPQLLGPLMTGNCFQIQVSGEAGVNYIIQGSTDLVTWADLFTTNAVTMPLTWTDRSATHFSARFYRALLGTR